MLATRYIPEDLSDGRIVISVKAKQIGTGHWSGEATWMFSPVTGLKVEKTVSVSMCSREVAVGSRMKIRCIYDPDEWGKFRKLVAEITRSGITPDQMVYLQRLFKDTVHA